MFSFSLQASNPFSHCCANRLRKNGLPEYLPSAYKISLDSISPWSKIQFLVSHL
jgi:hypothetical protein